MSRIIQIVAAAVLLAFVVGAALVFPTFHNMSAEYGTVAAIDDLGKYLQEHEGRWPTTAEDLGGKYPAGGEVYLDYSVISSRLIESPRLLREAVRPRSGKFHTYPHYEKRIEELYAALCAANKGQDVEPASLR